MGEVELPPWLKALPQAPEFHPTEAEFADPIAYILKVEEEAKQYGICKIIPPFTKASKKVVVTNLNRSLSLSAEALSSTVHGSCGPLSRSMGGVAVGPQLAKPKGLFLDASCTDWANKAKFATRRQQLGWNPKRARGVAHSQNHKLVWQSGESYTLEQFEQKAKMFSRSRLGTCKDVSALSVESLFWRAAAEKPISVEYANDIPGSAFAELADSFSSTPFRLKKRKRGPEDADQPNLDGMSVACRNEEKFQEEEVAAGSDEFDPSDPSKSKTGGLEAGGDNAGGVGSKLANSAWNMRNVARSQGSLLRFMPEEVPGVTSPMVYIGMLFSWFAWHVEDHELHSLNYLHMGASKTWYAVPGDAAPALEEAIRVHGYGGYLDPRAAFSLLGEKTTVMSPEVLVAAGVPCCRLVQNAGEYVVTFPRAYHLGFSHGFNCGEAANFATPGWLEVAKEAAARRAAMNYLPMLSHQQLLYLLSMSLPPRMPASSPSEPRSSRLKVKKKSLGEEMVKSKFLHDVLHNNRLLRILLDNGVSQCLLAKDAVHHMPTMAKGEDSEHKVRVPPLGCSRGPEVCSQGGDSTHVPSQQVSSTEGTKDDHFQCQPPCTPVPCAPQAVFRDLSVGKHEEILLTDPSARSITPANEQALDDTEAKPIQSENLRVTTSLALDWGTLPCAACGILCYATLAVVEPSSAAAVTFKPIFAAAGLGHCAFDADEAGGMTTSLPTVSCARPSPGMEVSLDKVASSFQPAFTDGRSKEDDHGSMSAEFRFAGEVKGSEETVLAAYGCLSPEPTTKRSEVAQGRMGSSGATDFDNQQEATMQISDACQDIEVKLEIITTFVNSEQKPFPIDQDNQCLLKLPEGTCPEEIGVDHAPSLIPATPDTSVLLTGNLDGTTTACSDWKEADHKMTPSHDLFAPPTPVSNCQTSDSEIINCVDSQPQASPLQQSLDSNESDRVRTAGCPDTAEICFPEEHGNSDGPGISSLQLLASIYDESSDLEDESIPQAAAEDSNAVLNEVLSIDEVAEGGEVLAKPHRGVGDLLTDVVGLSADVPWLSLVPDAAETPDLPPSTVASPLFTFQSLVEGEKSLEKVFVSGGFRFVEIDEDIPDPVSLASSLSVEQSGKQSSEVTSCDGDHNNPNGHALNGDNEKVFDMQELYHRINSQALTVDSDGDEQMLFNYGLRPPGTHMPEEALNLEVSKSTSTARITSHHRWEPNLNPQVGTTLWVPPCAPSDSPFTSSAPSSMGLAKDNLSTSSASAPSHMALAVDNASKESGTSHATSQALPICGVSELHYETSAGGRSSRTSNQDGAAAACPQITDHMKESGPRKVVGPRACKSVARPRVLCLEHAVEAQERLRSVGGARVLIVCHSDFENYEVRAKQLTEEFGIEHAWRHVPFSKGADDEVSMVSTAVDIEDDDGRRVNDWVMQMGLFVHHRFRDRESESSDDAQNASEDFRAGPFTGKLGKPARSRLMAGRLGLSCNSGGRPRIYSKSSSQIIVPDSKRLPKTTKKKKCVVAGRWCGRVWRVNQVHPFLGGSRKVDPSLQLGMSSTSLYALSVMSECDGGKYRKGISSSRIEASPVGGQLIPVSRSAEEQQGIAARNRGRKRKAAEQGAYAQVQPECHRKMATSSTGGPQSTLAVCRVGLESGDCSSSPKNGILAENGSGCVVEAMNDGEEGSTVGGGEGQLTMQVFPASACQSDANPATQSSEAGLNNQCVQQMLSLTPLAIRDPSEQNDGNEGLTFKNKELIGEGRGTLDKHLQSAVVVSSSGNEYTGSSEIMRADTCLIPVSVPSESHQAADVKDLEFHLTPSPLPLSSIAQDGFWQKTTSLTNVYSTSPLIGRGVKSSTSSSLVAATSIPTDGNRISGFSYAASCVWRDVPLASAPSLLPVTSPLAAGHFAANTAPPSFPNSSQNHLYIPYVCASLREAMSDTLMSQTSHREVYSEVSNKALANFEEGGAKLQGVHLLQQQNVVGQIGQIHEAGTAGGNLDQESPKCATGKPVLYDELGTSVQPLATPPKLLGFKRKRDRHLKSVYLGDKALDPMEANIPSLLDRVTRSSHLVAHKEDCGEGSSCQCPDLSGTTSEKLVCEIGMSQESSQDIKNVMRLPDNRGQCISEAAEQLANAGGGHLHVCRTEEGQSTANDFYPVHLQDAHLQNPYLYDRKQSIEVTPVLTLPPSLIESHHQGALVGSGELQFSDASGQGGALEHPLAISLPLRSGSSRGGRSAVKARGKRAKPCNVGWKNFKQAQPERPGVLLEPHLRAAGDPSIFTLQPDECVEARFEVEECDRVLAILDQSTSTTCAIPSLGLHGLTAEEDESEEQSGEPETVAVKPKKKGKPPKKKKAPPRKPAEEVGEFQCDLEGCRMSFGSDAELQIHKRNRCTFKGCGKRFFMHKYLLQHRRVHLDERPLKCPWKGCKQAFKWAWARTEHIRVHTGERPYHCPDCEQTFRFVSDFSRHKRNTGHTKS